MSLLKKVGLLSVVLGFIAFCAHQIRHFNSYGHLAPLGLHADVLMTTSAQIIGVTGVAKINHARLTNYGVLPTHLVACNYKMLGAPETELNYITERWDNASSQWKYVPDWDFGSHSHFCGPQFEVTDEHVATQWLWPGRSIETGERPPGQIGGFGLNEYGRFTIFLAGNGDMRKAVSTSTFRVDQVPQYPVRR